MSNLKPTTRRVLAILSIFVAIILFYICLSVPSLRLFSPFALAPLLFNFNSSRSGLVRMLKLVLIVVIWAGLMVAVNGPQKIKENIDQGIRIFDKKYKHE